MEKLPPNLLAEINALVDKCWPRTETFVGRIYYLGTLSGFDEWMLDGLTPVGVDTVLRELRAHQLMVQAAPSLTVIEQRVAEFKEHAATGRHLPRGVSVILYRLGHFYVAKRVLPTDPYVNLWTFPGGRVEVGEPVRFAAARELKEETNLDVTRSVERLVPLGSEIITKPDGERYVGCRYGLELLSGEDGLLRNTEPERHTNWTSILVPELAALEFMPHTKTYAWKFVAELLTTRLYGARLEEVQDAPPQVVV